MTTPKRPRGRPRSAFTDSSAGTLQALDRALGVLAEVARRDGASLTDLSRALDIPTATTHRILTTLQGHDFVRFDEERQDWTIGIEAYRTGVAYLKRTNLADAGRPVMRRLMEETGETANLAVPDRAEVVFIGQVETGNPIRAFFPPGSRTPMHASGIGKAILAALPEDRLRHLLPEARLAGFTPRTHRDTDSLAPISPRPARAGGRSTATSATRACPASAPPSSTGAASPARASRSRGRPRASPTTGSARSARRSPRRRPRSPPSSPGAAPPAPRIAAPLFSAAPSVI